MSADTDPEYDRVTIDAGSDSTATTATTSGGGIRGRLAALSSRFRQTVQTRSSSPVLGTFSRGVETVQPADGVDEFYAVYEDTAIVFTSLWNFSSDVWEPGIRIEAEDDEAEEWLEEEWLPQAAILYGGKHNDFLPFGKHTTIQRWCRGGALIEHVRADPDDPDSMITGVNFIPPETVSFVPYEHKPILVDPDPPSTLEDELPDELPETRRGELPAYIQYHQHAPHPTKRDPIPLSQNDVTRTIFNGDAAGVGTDLDNFWGTPITEIVAEDVAGFKNILRDKETAIKNKAYGLWAMAFDREVLEYTDIDDKTGETVNVTEIIEWSEEDKDQVANEIEEDMGPGGILTHDGEIELDRLDGEVPELIDDLEFYVSNITAALPTPLYVVGFESNINQFVVEGQDTRYQQLIDQERQTLQRTFSSLLERVIESHPDHETEWVRFKIEPEEEKSPVLSMTDEETQRLQQWASAFDTLRGDVPVDSIMDREELLTLILQLPEDSVDVPDDVGEQTQPDMSDIVDEVANIAQDDSQDGGGEAPPQDAGADEDEETEELQADLQRKRAEALHTWTGGRPDLYLSREQQAEYLQTGDLPEDVGDLEYLEPIDESDPDVQEGAQALGIGAGAGGDE